VNKLSKLQKIDDKICHDQKMSQNIFPAPVKLKKNIHHKP